MIIQVNFKDSEANYAEPIYYGEKGKARAFLIDERILFKHEVTALFRDGYTPHPEGEFYWEELS